MRLQTLESGSIYSLVFTVFSTTGPKQRGSGCHRGTDNFRSDPEGEARPGLEVSSS